MTRARIISVDLQKEFTEETGKHYQPRPSVNFIRKTIIPFFKRNQINVGEIISDYRQPRPGDRDDSCYPGTKGYQSEMPEEIKSQPVWIKSMNSPIWTRQGIGNPKVQPGVPYQDPVAFTMWLEKTIGSPEKAPQIILMGLTLDCCVFCTTQELKFRGYEVRLLEEATDIYSGDQKAKSYLLREGAITNWAKPITFIRYTHF